MEPLIFSCDSIIIIEAIKHIAVRQSFKSSRFCVICKFRKSAETKWRKKNIHPITEREGGRRQSRDFLSLYDHVLLVQTMMIYDVYLYHINFGGTHNPSYNPSISGTPVKMTLMREAGSRHGRECHLSNHHRPHVETRLIRCLPHALWRYPCKVTPFTLRLRLFQLQDSNMTLVHRTLHVFPIKTLEISNLENVTLRFCTMIHQTCPLSAALALYRDLAGVRDILGHHRRDAPDACFARRTIWERLNAGKKVTYDPYCIPLHDPYCIRLLAPFRSLARNSQTSSTVIVCLPDFAVLQIRREHLACCCFRPMSYVLLYLVNTFTAIVLVIILRVVVFTKYLTRSCI